ncbi:hypothetical protein QFZ82_005001 [Streptomyces sp. V4I23]|nr:hypothetical protein [Streptomyces sp. V4I23]MDQ1010516.1 hypothetical protein [Streptomyces sp. V4I23]
MDALVVMSTASPVGVTYTTQDPVPVDALHDWFEAQLGDHGAHAESGH